MKSLILLFLFLLTALTYVNAQTPPEQIRPEQTGGNTGKVRDALFPDFKKDIANIQAKSAQTKPDRSIISTPTKQRLFTNYQPSRSTTKTAATSKKTAKTPSDTGADKELKQNKAPQPVATPIPNQDGSGTPAPHKKN